MRPAPPEWHAAAVLAALATSNGYPMDRRVAARGFSGTSTSNWSMPAGATSKRMDS